MGQRKLMMVLGWIVATVTFMAAGSDRGNTMTGIFHEDFRTLTVGVEGDRLAPPVITLGSGDRLTIGFDVLREERDYLRYSILHCDANWEVSNVVDSEVFDGFNYADVEDYAFSRGTTVHYVHYTIRLPNEEFQFRLSGNYLLQVYEENEPDEILLQVRFMVSEGIVGVGGEATSRTDREFNGRYQQLGIAVDMNRASVRDAWNDLQVVVTQNGRSDDVRVVKHPTRMMGERMIYEHIPELIWEGGNEYRRMETVQMTYPGMGVEEIEYHAPYYHHYLTVGEPRYAKSYQYDSTQHGRFFVREYNSDNSDTEADYSVVHFVLGMLEIPDVDVFVEGDVSYRHFDDNSRMRYDAEAGVYHKAMLLKQGAYNYQYVGMKRGSGEEPWVNNGVKQRGDNGLVEGDFYQTVNEYWVGVYYRAPGDRYDRLLGYTVIYSGR